MRRRQGGTTVGARVSLEVLVASEHDAIQAVSNGADRLLLCSAPEVGGLTPTPAVLARVRDIALRESGQRKRAIPVTVMIRPRAGGFYYGDAEFALMREEARRLLELGADGIAFGVLDLPSRRTLADGAPDVRIDRDRCAELVELAHAKGKKAVFNRAFDLLPDRRTGLNDLIQLRCDRVITSGGRRLALDGSGVLAADVQFAGWDIEVVATGEITPDTIMRIIADTGCTSVMDSFHRPARDHSLPPTHPIAYALGCNQGGYPVTDGGLVQRAVTRLRELEQDPDDRDEPDE
jgi:copper homeostasis protein